MSESGPAHAGVRYPPTRALWDARYHDSVWPRCPVLLYVVPGTAICGACYAVSGTGIAYGGFFKGAIAIQLAELKVIPCTLRNQVQEHAISVQFVPGMRFLVLDFGVYQIRARYAMSGTCIAYAAACLPARYAMSGTGIAYGTVCLGACCAMSGTGIRYRSCRYAWSLVAPYAMSAPGIVRHNLEISENLHSRITWHVTGSVTPLRATAVSNAHRHRVVDARNVRY
eukprot:227705-Rhodomonas_salina.2